MQGWCAAEHQERLEEGGNPEHHLPRHPDHRLLRWLLCFQEQPVG